MKEFRSIESFRHIVKEVKRYCSTHGKPLPTLEFAGSCKIHGSNCGVRITPSQMHPQSRSRLISISNDNYGFAQFINKNESFIRELYDIIGHKEITIFGEWCGEGIQNKVAVCQLKKHWVIFSIYDHETEKYLKCDDLVGKIITIDQYSLSRFNDNSIYFIAQIGEYSLTVDFEYPEDATNIIEQYTIEVEKECPWAKFLGVSGIGEGIVWRCKQFPDIWFKSKGVEHQKNAKKVKAYAPRLQHKELVAEILPEWRLEQGISYLKENNIPFEKSSIPHYLKWVGNDIIKEEMDVLNASNVEWKDVVKEVADIARNYYLKKIDEDAFDEK